MNNLKYLSIDVSDNFLENEENMEILKVYKELFGKFLCDR